MEVLARYGTEAQKDRWLMPLLQVQLCPVRVNALLVRLTQSFLPSCSQYLLTPPCVALLSPYLISFHLISLCLIVLYPLLISKYLLLFCLLYSLPFSSLLFYSIPFPQGDIRSCFAMTEPDVASSDATNMESTVSREGNRGGGGGEVVLSGSKWWTSGAMDPRCKVQQVEI